MSQPKLKVFVAFSRFTSEVATVPPDIVNIRVTIATIGSSEFTDLVGHSSTVVVEVPEDILLSYSDTSEMVLNKIAEAVKDWLVTRFAAQDLSADDISVVFVGAPGRF